MTSQALHPWLSTPEAMTACRKSVEVAVKLAGIKALTLGRDELLSVARYLMTECAAPPRETVEQGCARCGGSLAEVRKGAKFCSAKCRFDHANGRRVPGEPLASTGTRLPDSEHAHIGSMWTWPEDQRLNYAIREVSRRLANHAVVQWTRSEASGTPSSGWLYNADRDDDAGDGTDMATAFSDATPASDVPLANPADEYVPLAFHVFEGPGYLTASAEGLCTGEWHRRPAVESYARQADGVIRGLVS